MDSHHLQKIQTFYRDHKRMPSYSELMAVAGFRSKNAAYKLIERFVRRGWLEKDETGKLLPGRRFHDLRLLGVVAAGFPSPPLPRRSLRIQSRSMSCPRYAHRRRARHGSLSHPFVRRLKSSPPRFSDRAVPRPLHQETP
jgi:hypothetical protein